LKDHRVGCRFASWIAGDAGAGEDLWRLVRLRIAAILRRKFRLSRGEAAEAAEEAFEELYLHGNALRSEDGAWGYLLVTAERKALSLIRRRNLVPLPSDEIQAGNERDSEAEERHDSFVHSLPFDLRRLALLIQSKTPRVEIQRLLGVSDRTLRRRIVELKKLAGNFFHDSSNR